MKNKLLNNIKSFTGKVNSILLEICQLSIAILMLSGLFYIRLLPRVSRELWEHMNHYQLLSTVMKLVLVGLNIYVLLLVLGKLSTKEKSPFLRRLSNIFSVISEYLLWLLCNLYEFVWYILGIVVKKLFNYQRLHYHTIRKLAGLLWKTRTFDLYCYTLITVALLPKIIFVIAFMFDVFFCQQLHYTFLCLPLLLLSLIEKFILFIFSHYLESYEKAIKSFIEETLIETENGPLIKYCFRPGVELVIKEYFTNFKDYYVNHYGVLVETGLFLDYYKNFKENQFPYYQTLLVLSAIRFLLLIFILVYGTI